MDNKEKNRKFLCVKAYHKISLINTTFSLFFNLLPFWAGILLTISIGKWTDWSRFYSNGEFYLYSTSLASSAYLIYHNYRLKSTDLSSIFSIISLFIIVITSVLYAFLRANPEPQLNIFIKTASILAILAAVPLFFYSQVISHRNSPDLGQKRKNEQETIMQRLS